MPIRNMTLAGLFAALIAISSQISVPIGPVPHTLQVFFVMLAGIILGGRWGFVSVLVWIALGAFGLPVFYQGKAGLMHILGPTGGFMFGFALCALLVGWLTGRARLGFGKTFLILLLGLAVIYAVGLTGFMASFAFFLKKPMGLDKALSLAVLPFLPFDAVKAALAAYVGVKVRRSLMMAGYIQER
ncbi:biotin transporter BioY [Anaeroselena agilis]|uniref:Biotin transporter n=1 Tax=Anaeroselena agilis TaxID=3063788 RepID=A0ABU3P2A1_9FIRM|nr:biotin transporter BioY [Selenomonadales bacterium 4137-cl]